MPTNSRKHRKLIKLITLIFSLPKVDNPPAAVLSLIQMMNQEKDEGATFSKIPPMAIHVQVWGSDQGPVTNHNIAVI